MPPETLAPGRKIQCPEGYTAFLPDPPPELTWTPRLVMALSDATGPSAGWRARAGGYQIHTF